MNCFHLKHINDSKLSKYDHTNLVLSFYILDNISHFTTTTTTSAPTTKSTEIPKTTSAATETKIAREVTENPLENLLLTTKANFTTTPTSGTV